MKCIKNYILNIAVSKVDFDDISFRYRISSIRRREKGEKERERKSKRRRREREKGENSNICIPKSWRDKVFKCTPAFLIVSEISIALCSHILKINPISSSVKSPKKLLNSNFPTQGRCNKISFYASE